ncbi:cell division protein FtsB [Micrococcus endophyticus]|uniref:Cell division protein FtsB n=1 Tax=Micrococcus endophyticus TaxID=455343 RepID=A0A7W9JKD1_9MICC|nr:septum formation initiator family protein [Micrococcus endophyticus]MBB5848862.1 cell division protein FtsB [Micrococcus endophyticus]
MSPRRPRVPRVDPATGAPRRAAQDAAVEPTTAPQDPAAEPPRADSRPAPAEAAGAPAAPSPPAAPGTGQGDGSAPSAEPERPATAEVIDLQRAQDRRQGGPAAPEHAAGSHAAGTRPAEDRRAGANAARPAASSPARPAARRPRPAPRRALSPAAMAARRRAPLPDPVPARQITGRSLLVVAVLLVAAVLVAPTLRAFLNQQLEIAAAEEEIAAMQAQREDYEERIRLWDDPGYVTQQARERLELVMPGETLYSVTGVPEEAPRDPRPEAPAGEPVNTRLPWAEGLWDSAVRAGLE